MNKPMGLPNIRSPLQITLAVWKALFLREALARLFNTRGAWFWLLAEPVLHMSYMLIIFSVIRIQHIGGIDTVLWLIAGLLAFSIFRKTGTQCANAISANRSLFTYRQVKPVDTVLVRSILEAVLFLCVMVLMLAGLELFGIDAVPADSLTVVHALTALWILGLGYGLISSVVSELLPDIERILVFSMMPMYLVSGVVFPLGAVPQPYRDWILLNPVAHGVEAVRLGFANHYHAVPELSVSYLLAWALGALFIGLALHKRFAQRLVTA